MATTKVEAKAAKQNGGTSNALFKAALETAGVNIMMCDRDLNITYANEATGRLIADNLEIFSDAFPGFNPDDLIGTCIDSFHKDPAYQRRILGNPKNLPHQADIKVGPKTFALNISAVHDEEGEYMGNCLEWQDATQARSRANEAARLSSSVDGSNTASMTVDNDLIITYMNPATVRLITDNLSEFQTAYPGIDFTQVGGVCIDIFHKDPALQRKVLGDPKNLPHQADIQIGNLTFALNISAMYDAGGTYIGANLEWQDVTKAREEASRAESLYSMIEGASAFFMTCDRDLNITYMNPSLKEMLQKYEHEVRKAVPSFDVNSLIGTCIDGFHKNPAHQRRLLEDVRNLPATVEIKVGDLEFEVTATALYDDAGNHIGNGAEWGDLNDRARYRDEVTGLIDASNEGDLSKRGDVENLSEEYKPMMEGINDIIDAIVAPINEAGSVLKLVAGKDLTSRIVGDYKGDHAAIKNNLNDAMQNLETAMSQALDATGQVNAASGQIAQGSQNLAQGASEQASSLEEISASLEELTAMTNQNADNATQANSLAQDQQVAATKGADAMKKMEEAITSISTSAEQTSKIVKTIDEIAFQTNLLALNAAVEAARAGDAGKGFAVVAEEVRSLAARSAEAAKTTADLIEGSVKNAEGGVRITEEVASVLSEIVTGSEKVGSLIGEIAAASKEQAAGIAQINDGVTQLDSVTQQNAANSEESAAAAEELNAQAQSLTAMLSAFKLGQNGQGMVSPSMAYQGVPAQAMPPAGMAPGQYVQAQQPPMQMQPAFQTVPVQTAVQQSFQQPVQQVVQQVRPAPIAPVAQELRPEEVIPLDDNDLKSF